MRRHLFRWFFFVLLLLFGVIAVNTFLFPSKQIPVEPVEAISIEDAVLERLSSAIQIPTISNSGFLDTSAFREMGQYIHQTYPLVDSFLTHQSVGEFSHVYKWPGKNAKLKPVLFVAHLDVVPVAEGSRDLWKFPPFGGKIEEGSIWGRGVLDDKLSVFGWLETAEQLLTENYQPERTLYFAFGHDEEIGGENGAAAIASHFNRQGIRFAYVLDEGMTIVQEALPGLTAPVAIIGIAEKGYLSLKLDVQLSEGGHSSMPPKETAITILGDAIKKLQQNPFPMKINGATQSFFEHAGPEATLPFRAVFANLSLTGGLIKVMLRNDPGGSALLRTTMAPTLFQSGIKENVLPTEAAAKIGRAHV